MNLADKIRWQIDMRLHEPITVAELAQLCGVSPFHLSRVFRDGTGLSPMAYLRARRLSWAAKALATGDADILCIALDAQYASHEAFTRAFAAYFGVLPSRIRQTRDLSKLTLMEHLTMDKSMIVPVAPHRMETKADFRLVGMGVDCTFDDISGITPLWQAFNPRAGEIEGADHTCGYGVCCDADAQGNFRYIAGVEASGEAPAGMETRTIPAGDYAVFTHEGHITDFPKTVYTIWNKSLPDAGLNARDVPNFERYDRRFNPETGHGLVEVWIPV